MATCGLTTAGWASIDEGQSLPLHGRASVGESHRRVIAQAALGRAQGQMMLDAIAFEHLQTAAVHDHRHGHDDLATRMTQRF